MIAERLARRIARTGLPALYVRPATGAPPQGSWPVAVLLAEARPTGPGGALTLGSAEATLAAAALPPAVVPAERDQIRIGGKTWSVAARPLPVQVLGRVVAWRLVLGGG
jgi:hypothetical protein